LPEQPDRSDIEGKTAKSGNKDRQEGCAGELPLLLGAKTPGDENKRQRISRHAGDPGCQIYYGIFKKAGHLIREGSASFKYTASILPISL